MNPKEKIAKVIEERKREATEKNLRHKLMAIATTMGEPVLTSSEWSLSATDEGLGAAIYFQQHSFDSAEMEMESELFPTSEENNRSVVVGWYFDALRLGANIQITHLPREGELKVYLDGHLVFREEFGELTTYIPVPAWESRIDHWAKTAEVQLGDRKKTEEQEQLREQQSIIEQTKAYLKRFWGLDFSQKKR